MKFFTAALVFATIATPSSVIAEYQCFVDTLFTNSDNDPSEAGVKFFKDTLVDTFNKAYASLHDIHMDGLGDEVGMEEIEKLPLTSSLLRGANDGMVGWRHGWP